MTTKDVRFWSQAAHWVFEEASHEGRGRKILHEVECHYDREPDVQLSGVAFGDDRSVVVVIHVNPTLPAYDSCFTILCWLYALLTCRKGLDVYRTRVSKAFAQRGHELISRWGMNDWVSMKLSEQQQKGKGQ